MSSNKYAPCVSRNLVRTSLFGYHEQASLCGPREGFASPGLKRLPWAIFKAFPNFSSGRDGRRLTWRQDTALLPI
ncbi:hypothetical protein HNQ72_006059 [Rhizobium wenxiniae]|uniref:Uncharacterized protein n=1 Tax=Rhizobium wenxiniae TaxID=1737357 RepID=A0A7W9YE16_9HYPH|nr:hypothetical protein [Rhizobium wenxiniae]